MRLLALVLISVPMLAHAAQKEGADWRNCHDDADCVQIEGTCGKTAVNKAFRSDAETFYRQEKETTKCVEQFWRPKNSVAQCRLNSCSTAAKPPKK